MSLCEVGVGRDLGVRGGSRTQVLCKYYKDLCGVLERPLSNVTWTCQRHACIALGFQVPRSLPPVIDMYLINSPCIQKINLRPKSRVVFQCSIKLAEGWLTVCGQKYDLQGGSIIWRSKARMRRMIKDEVDDPKDSEFQIIRKSRCYFSWASTSCRNTVVSVPRLRAEQRQSRRKCVGNCSKNHRSSNKPLEDDAMGQGEGHKVRE
ncbi:hypothetical protein DFH07DRAFT_779360 [Mycena maculata]|uniref:Uncharacterized protein n=1 Tax=Mycena maculata TaxID=230809 RepID=A0AAD7I8H5_9AGAR|nr:hypothetical protein DFH07DRAFT_779360 [Mycena maculata]